MHGHYATAQKKSSPEILPDQIILELEDDYRRELRKLSDGGFVFLSATEGDTVVAENLFEDFVNLLFEAGTLSLWRYRIVLSVIRAGL